MNPYVLIVSGLYDFSTDLVALRLQSEDVPYVRLNREQLKDYRISLDPVTPLLSIRGSFGDAEVGPNLRSIWFRQPVFLRNTPSNPLQIHDQLERSQWTAFLRALSVFQGNAWMNFPAHTYIAECKPYQLRTAEICGFNVPVTLATNDVKAIKERFSTEIIIKSLDTILIHEKDDCLFTYTTLSSLDDLNDQNVSTVPLLAQQELRNKTDIRVTVVGDRIFAVRILVAGNGIAGDWRLVPKTELEYRDFQLPEKLADQCQALARQLGLSFAAIDLIETPEKIFFIEVNPTGEWGWLSNPERPIDQAIASWLANPSLSSR